MFRAPANRSGHRYNRNLGRRATDRDPVPSHASMLPRDSHFAHPQTTTTTSSVHPETLTPTL